MRKITHFFIWIVCAVTGLAILAKFAQAETMVEYSAEARFQLDLRVPDAALASYLPRAGRPTSPLPALPRMQI